MLIAVPRGAKAGDRLVLDTSTGARWVVPLPPGATHGTTLTIARPQTAAHEHIVQVVLMPPPGAVGAVEASPRAAVSSAGFIAAEGRGPSRGPSLLRQHATPRPPPGSETLDVGGWQVVVTDRHAVLPEGMTHLPDKAFQGRTSLVSVACPRSLVSIGYCAFERCSALASVTLPAGLTSIGKGAFDSCSSLPTVTLPAGLISIDDNAFYGCSSLARVTFPATLTFIGDCAFVGCSALASITFPAGLEFIGDCAFVGCSALTSVTFPAGLTCISYGVSFTIGDFAFSDSPLTRVTVPTTAAIGQDAFEPTTAVLRLPPARMRDLQRWYAAVDLALAYKRCRPLLYGWLERANIRLGSYGPEGAARQRDREAFEGDFPAAALPPPPPPNAGAAAASSSGSYGQDGADG